MMFHRTKYLKLFLTIVIILIFAAVEMKVVFGDLYKNGYNISYHLLAAFFLLFNVIGNLVYCYIADNRVVNSEAWKKIKIVGEPSNWRFCEKCQILAPPQSWHCNYCQTCILRRSHHCLITGGCIGLNNIRYFLVFLMFGAIGTIYGFILNIFYVFWLNNHVFAGILSKLSIFNPVFLIFKYIWDDETLSLWSYAYIPAFTFMFFSVILTNVLVFVHGRKCLQGAINKSQTMQYNFGSWKRNFEMTLGENYQLVWIAPFIESKLPCDGVNWT